MRRACVVALVVALGGRAEAGEVRGRVVDGTTGAGVRGATVTADDGTSVETGADGGFVLVVADAGSLAVYADRFAPALVEVGTDQPLLVRLEVTSEDVEVIEVSGKIPDGASPTAYTLGRDQIRAMPGGGNDVLRAVQSLPGVGRVSYGLGGLVLRGAAPGHNGVYLDGIDVPQAFHFGGVSSFYPSTLLEEVVVSPGGADVAFGGDDGGHLELRARAPRGDRWRAGAEVGVLDASAYAEGPTGGGGAVLLGLRRSYADAFLPALLPEDRRVVPRYYDGQLRWERGDLTVMGFFSDDRVAGYGGTEFRQGFTRAAIRYRHRRGPVTLTVMPWAGWGRLRLDVTDPSVQQHQLHRAPLGLRADVVRDTAWGHVAAGVDLRDARVTLSFTDAASPAFDLQRAGWVADVGAWAEARWRIAGGKLTVKPGVRVDHFGGAARWVVDPRLVTTHELASWLTLREEIGIYHQAPSGSVLDGEVADRPGEHSVNASWGGRVELPGAVIASLSAYHVAAEGPPVGTESGGLHLGAGLGIALDKLVAEELEGVDPGRRRGYGVELSAQRRTERWLLWLAYTLSRSERHAGSISLTGWYPDWVNQTHNLNAVASVRVGAWQLGARLRWTTGFPYTPSDFYARTNSARLADFVSLDLRVNRSWRRGWGTVGAFLDVQNVTNADNPEGISYDEVGTPHVMRGLPILPIVGVSYQPPDAKRQ